MNRLILLTIVALGVALLNALPVTASPERYDEVHRFLTRAQANGFSGVVLIARSDDVLFHRAYPDNDEINSETAFWIGSLAKPMTAMAIVQLQRQRKLSTADPISKHLHDVPADKRHITIHHLLTHTSGLSNTYLAEGIADRQEAAKQVLAAPLAHEPGAIEYSNDGYNVLAILIEAVSEMPFESFIRAAIFKPSGMTASGFWNKEAFDRSELAPILNRPAEEIMQPNWGYKGSTGIHSTASDLHRWALNALARDAVLPGFHKEIMLAPHVPFSSDHAYGYGIEVMRNTTGKRVYAHIGSNSELQHTAEVRYHADDGLIFVFLSNSAEELAVDVFESVEKLFLDAAK